MQDASFGIGGREDEPELLKGVGKLLGNVGAFFIACALSRGNDDQKAAFYLMLAHHRAQSLAQDALDTVARDGRAELFGYGESDAVDLCLLGILTAKKLRL